jgi:hypothetical protein
VEITSSNSLEPPKRTAQRIARTRRDFLRSAAGLTLGTAITSCQLSLYLRIERHSITLRANGVTTLFANESARTL